MGAIAVTLLSNASCLIEDDDAPIKIFIGAQILTIAIALFSFLLTVNWLAWRALRSIEVETASTTKQHTSMEKATKLGVLYSNLLAMGII